MDILTPDQLKLKLRIIKRPVGASIDAMFDLREKKRELDEQVKAVGAEIEVYTQALLESMKTQGLTSGRGDKASASITSTVCANIQDWDALTAFVKKTGNFQLFQRRVSDPAFRELLAKKGVVPGLDEYNNIRLNLTTLRK